MRWSWKEGRRAFLKESTKEILSIGVVVWQRRRWPWLMWGWLWYVIASLPTIGFVQAFTQAYADRYSMKEFIGLEIYPFFFSTSANRSSTDRVTHSSMSRTGVL